MAKIKKKGTSGNAKNFITRTQAVRKLQISLPDFRRLCIFKGIYPREPRNKKKANKGNSAPNTFYYTKDIQYLLHEPVLQKFREHKAFAKKLTKALARGEYGDAKRLEENHKPVIRLDHIIKERYPTFTDALRDLDDALSMLHLFANLPSNNRIPVDIIAKCDKLCNEFQHYIIRTGALRKSFLSIKGIYYQAEIQGQDILWLVPYKFAQNVPVDVDFRIMLTFVEFYTKLLGFVLFRLYTLEGLVYPPKFDAEADKRGAGLRAFSLENKSVGLLGSKEAHDVNVKTMKQLTLPSDVLEEASKNDDLATEVSGREDGEYDSERNKDSIDVFVPTTEKDADVLAQPINDNDGTSGPEGMFSDFVIFLNRETPRQPLEFILRAFGCNRIGWDAVLGDGAFTNDPLDPSITHQVVDRPVAVGLPPMPAKGEHTSVPTPAHGRIPGRIYVQPQYVWDCINAGRILRPDAYAPGAILPPHLSPWIKVDASGYDPTADIGAASEEGESEEEEIAADDMDVDLDSEKEEVENSESDDYGVVGSGEESDSETQRREYQKELEAEALGKEIKDSPKKSKKEKAALSKREREEQEMKEMQKMMMPRKKRKLYEKMIYSNKKKEEEAESLRAKRKRIEKEKKKAAA